MCVTTQTETGESAHLTLGDKPSSRSCLPYLGRCGRLYFVLMNRDMTQVLKMNRRGKRVFLRRLERLERIYGEESKHPVKGQRKLTSFFVRVEEEVESIQAGGETNSVMKVKSEGNNKCFV